MCLFRAHQTFKTEKIYQAKIGKRLNFTGVLSIANTGHCCEILNELFKYSGI